MDSNEILTKGPLSLRERDRERGPDKNLQNAKRMRSEASDAERLLWKHLRAHRLHGYKFKRQVVIEPYIVDFLCLEAKLIIEADGGQHMEQQAYDTARTKKLEAKGYKVLRFWNHDILSNTDAVLGVIENVLSGSPRT